MHFTILKVIATSGLLTALECTKFVFIPVPRTPQLGLTALTRPLARNFEGQGRGREGKR